MIASRIAFLEADTASSTLLAAAPAAAAVAAPVAAAVSAAPVIVRAAAPAPATASPPAVAPATGRPVEPCFAAGRAVSGTTGSSLVSDAEGVVVRAVRAGCSTGGAEDNVCSSSSESGSG